MFSFINKKYSEESECQRKLFEELNIGDIFLARMTLNEEQENRIEESHKKRPFLMVGKDEDVYALALTTKYYPNGHYPLTKKKYEKLKKDSYIDFREVHIITKKNLESFSFAVKDEDLNKVVKLFNLLKERGEHSLEIDYKTKFSSGDLVSYNNKKYLVYKIDGEKIYTIRLNYSVNETNLRLGGVYFNTNFKVRIFRTKDLKLEGVCNNLAIEQIEKMIKENIPVLNEDNLEANEEDLNNCLKLIKFRYLDNNECREIYLNTLTFSATKAYGTLNIDNDNIIEVPFMDYEVIRDLTYEEKKKLILSTKSKMLKKRNINIDVVFKKYKNEVGNVDIYNKGDIFNYKGNIYLLYKIENSYLYTIKLKDNEDGKIVIDGKKYELSKIKRKFSITDSFNYTKTLDIDNYNDKINEIDKKGTFIDFGTIININGEPMVAIYVDGNDVWGIADWDNPLLKKVKAKDYSIIGDISIKNLRKIKELAPKFNNLLPDEINLERNDIKFGDIIEFNTEEKVVNLIILKNSGNKFYGIESIEKPDIYKYKLYKNKYSIIGQVSNDLLFKLKRIYDNNEDILNEESNFRKGR